MPPMSKRWIFFPLALVLLFIIFAAALVYTFSESPQLGGIVRDVESDAVIPAVEISAGDARAVTNADGEYALVLARGKSQLIAQADGYLTQEQEVTVGELPARALRLDLALVPNRIMGYVLDAETNQTLPNVQMHVGERVITTNDQGVFEAHAVKTGAPITVQGPGYISTTLTFAGDTMFNVSLAPNTVRVTVMDAANEPVANARITAGDLAATSDAQGRATLRRVKAGTTLGVSAAGFYSSSVPFTGGDVVFALRPNTLDGTILDAATGKPVANALVFLGNSFVTANGQGAYRLENVPEQATITVKAPGYRKMQTNVSGARQRDVKLSRFAVKAIHIPFAMEPDRVRANIQMASQTELNAIVLDVKAEKGWIGWDSQVTLARQIQAPYLKGISLTEVIENCRTRNLYCIARLPVFQDTLLANTRPNLALRFPNGTVYADNNESAWTDPANALVWDYNIALAKEVVALGFDEIQFDYIRFPGQVAGLYTGASATQEGRIAAVTGFLARAQNELRPTGVFISADVFGLTTATDEEQYTGQRLRDVGPYLDYVSPMVYPDVWVDAGFLLTNGLQIKNCTEAWRCPYDVIYNSYKRAVEKTPTAVRLWLQAYPGRGNFTVTQYQVQKQAADDAGALGWMFWNGAGSYDARTFGPK